MIHCISWEAKLILCFYNSRIQDEDLASKAPPPPPTVALAAVRSKEVVLLLFVPSLLGFSVTCICFVLQYITSFLILQSSCWVRESFVFVCFCCFTSQVNSYGHCGTVSSLNHTFSWAGLNKRLTSNLCTYFRL